MEKTLHIPKPKTKFLKIECEECKNVQVVFSSPSMKVHCLKCNAVLALPRSAVGEFKGKILEELG